MQRLPERLFAKRSPLASQSGRVTPTADLGPESVRLAKRLRPAVIARPVSPK
jgi:hypothetical protein